MYKLLFVATGILIMSNAPAPSVHESSALTSSVRTIAMSTLQSENAIIYVAASETSTQPEVSMMHMKPHATDTVHYPDEQHFRNVTQLTFGGDNAEAYFSFDNE